MHYIISMRNVLLLLCLALPLNIFSATPLEPIKTDTPRNTMRSYMEAMNDYKKGLQTHNRKLKARLDDAARCFNLEDVPILNRKSVGQNAAILLKEIMDRVAVIDYEKIPEKSEDPNQSLTRWMLSGTEITIEKIDKGNRAGEFLFNSETVSRVNEFYDKVDQLPYLDGTTGGAGYHTPWLERHMPSWASNMFLGLNYWQWIEIILTIMIGLVIGFLVSGAAKLIDRLVHRYTQESRLVQIMASPASLLITIGVWFIALHLLRIEGTTLKVLNVCLQVFLFISLTWFFYRAVELTSPYVKKVIHHANNKVDDQIVQLLDRSLKILVVILGILLGLQNLGIQVVSLLAGLGIGGLAFALAAKDTLANFFGSLMIMFDRPFQVGHLISVKGVSGSVEEIGFRSTKLRTPQNTLVSIPNSEIAITNIENFALRNFRNVKTTLGLSYNTSAEKIEAFIEGIKKIIRNSKHTKKEEESIQVFLQDFGDSKLQILINFFLVVFDGPTELTEKQNIFLEIIRLARKLEMDISPPTSIAVQGTLNKSD